jgi:hypothetical protein
MSVVDSPAPLVDAVDNSPVVELCSEPPPLLEFASVLVLLVLESEAAGVSVVAGGVVVNGEVSACGALQAGRTTNTRERGRNLGRMKLNVPYFVAALNARSIHAPLSNFRGHHSASGHLVCLQLVGYVRRVPATPGEHVTTRGLLAVSKSTRHTLYEWVAKRLLSRPRSRPDRAVSNPAVLPVEALERVRFIVSTMSKGMEINDVVALVEERWPRR